MKVAPKLIAEAIGLVAAIVAVVAFLTGRASLPDLLPHGKPPDTWYAASLTNETDDKVSFAVYHADRKLWGLNPIEAHATRTFVELNHPVHVMIQGQVIFSDDPARRLSHTYDGTECYELEGATFQHKPTDAEVRPVAANHFQNIGDYIILGPAQNGLKTFTPEDISLGRQLTVFDDPNDQVWVKGPKKP